MNMNKKLIVAAVSAAFAAPAAFAEVEVYGKVFIQLGQIDNDATDGSGLVMDNGASHFGFRGSDDLGGGLKGVFQIEPSISTETGGVDSAKTPSSGTDITMTGRDTFVGLEGDFGWVAAGRHNSPYKMATNSYDVAGDTVIDYNGIMGLSADGNKHDDRISSAVRFKSKDMNGLNVDVLWGVKDDVASAGGPPKTDQNTIALAVNYKQGPIEVNGAYSNFGEKGVAASASSIEDDVAFKVGGKFFFMDNQAWVAAVYEAVDSGTIPAAGATPAVESDRTDIYLAGLVKMGQSAIGIGYAMADEVGSVKDSGANLVQLVFKHNLSKVTNIFAQYGSLSLDKSASAGDFGLRSGSFTASAADKSATYFGVGIQTDFSSK